MRRIPTWMGLGTRWKVRCISIIEADNILAGCKRLENENRRWEHLHFQERLISMNQFSNLLAMAVPFQPQAVLPTPRLVDAVQGCQGSERDGSIVGPSPLQKVMSPFRDRSPSLGSHSSSQALDEGDLTTDGHSMVYISRKKKCRSRSSRGSQAGKSGWSTGHSSQSTSSTGGKKKKDGFSSKIQIPPFGGKKSYSDDVTGAFRQWA